MTTSVIIGCVSLYLVGSVSDLREFYILWAIIGACFAGALYDPCFALITRCRGNNAKQAIILITLIAGFASTISFPAAHYLAESLGWRDTVQIFAVCVLVLGVPAMWKGASLIESNKTTTPNQPVEHQQKPVSFYGSPVFWLLAIGFSFGALVHGVTLQHLIPILFDRGIQPDAAITAASFIGPMQVAGRIAMIAAQKHVSNHGIAVACFLVMALSIVFLILSAYVSPLVTLFVILFGGGYGMVSIIRPVIARDILGESSFGAKFGALSMVYLVGSASAPFLGSLVWGIGGYELVLPCLVVLAIAGMALYLAAWTTAKSRGPS